MSGVEILSSKTIYEMDAYWWFIVLFASVGLLIGLIIAIVDWINLGFDSKHIGFIIVCSLFGAYIGLLGAVMSEHETDTVDYIEYKVTISEDVPLVDFVEKYEILEQEGKIYTVRERK
jgi:uncharacterized protein YacL